MTTAAGICLVTAGWTFISRGSVAQAALLLIIGVGLAIISFGARYGLLGHVTPNSRREHHHRTLVEVIAPNPPMILRMAGATVLVTLLFYFWLAPQAPIYIDIFLAVLSSVVMWIANTILSGNFPK